MDIRVAAYSTATSSQSSQAARSIQPASTYIPVTPAAATRPVQDQQVAAATGNDGYTDSVRGSIINILA